MAAWRAAKLTTVFALLAACTTTPTDDRAVLSGKFEVKMTDSCGKLAGSLVLIDLFDIQAAPGEQDFIVVIEAEMDRRCPDDVKPEGLDVAFNIPTVACADLRGLVAMADAFGLATLPREQRDIADKLVDDLDDEIEKRCPPLE